MQAHKKGGKVSVSILKVLIKASLIQFHFLFGTCFYTSMRNFCIDVQYMYGPHINISVELNKIYTFPLYFTSAKKCFLCVGYGYVYTPETTERK